MAFDAERDKGLERIESGHLFHSNTTRVAIKRGAYLRNYVYSFAELLSDRELRERLKTETSAAEVHGLIERWQPLKSVA